MANELRYHHMIEKITIQRITRRHKESIEDVVIKERLLNIVLNKRHVITLNCSPLDLDYLAIGFLTSRELIKNRHEIKYITVDENKGLVEVETRLNINAPCLSLETENPSYSDISHQAVKKANPERIASKFHIPAAKIFSLVKEFEASSRIFLNTGGVHSAALCDSDHIMVFSEDIGRHNAIDKVFGRCILEDISTDERILITSCRVSSQIILKAIRQNISVFVTRSARTDMGIRWAEDSGITLAGFVRNERMNVYTHGWRIGSGQ